jgi:hypothetical protein
MRALLITLVFASALHAQQELVDPRSYVGNVYGRVAGAPGAIVTVAGDDGVVVRSASAAADGAFLINGVPAPFDGADYTVCAADLCKRVHVLPGAVMAVEMTFDFAAGSVESHYRHEEFAASKVQPESYVRPGIFATREGLVGGTTANGHVIVPNDHFVALPSRRALSTNFGYQRQVRLTFNDRTVVAPVWDVGPWNTHDDYWNPPDVRETFNDLPRGLPEADAAFTTGYHGGTDERGRRPVTPAGIDLADGTFRIDLALPDNTRIDVEFLWVDTITAPRHRAAAK